MAVCGVLANAAVLQCRLVEREGLRSREHFRREDLNHRLARPRHFRLQKSLRGSLTGKEGIALSSGEKWQELR